MPLFAANALRPTALRPPVNVLRALRLATELSTVSVPLPVIDPPAKPSPVPTLVTVPVSPQATAVTLPNSSSVIVSILHPSAVFPYVAAPAPPVDKLTFNVTSPSVPPPSN